MVGSLAWLGAAAVGGGGGFFGMAIVTILVVTVRVIGVLRTVLLVVAGQLIGAIVLDAAIPGGARPTPALAAGVVLTLVAAWVSGRPRLVPRPVRRAPGAA